MEIGVLTTKKEIKYLISVPYKVQNVFDSDEIKNIREKLIVKEVDVCIRKFLDATGDVPTTVALVSDQFYDYRQALQKTTGKYQSSDDCSIIYNDEQSIRIVGGCNLKDCEVLVSYRRGDKND